MSLKRKASFQGQSFNNRSFDLGIAEDVPRHLNSRTRKRFRDNRPDEQTIYANTLQILYQAQKDPAMSSLYNEPNESTTSTQEPLEPERPDSRQQTLLKFFRPTKALSSFAQEDMQCCKSRNDSKFNPEPVCLQTVTIEYEYECKSEQNTSTTGSSTPSSAGDVDMYMNIDTNSNIDSSSNMRLVDGAGWI